MLKLVFKSLACPTGFIITLAGCICLTFVEFVSSNVPPNCRLFSMHVKDDRNLSKTVNQIQGTSDLLEVNNDVSFKIYSASWSALLPFSLFNGDLVWSGLVWSQLDVIQDWWWESCQIWIWRMAHIQFRWVSQSVSQSVSESRRSVQEMLAHLKTTIATDTSDPGYCSFKLELSLEQNRIPLALVKNVANM